MLTVDKELDCIKLASYIYNKHSVLSAGQVAMHQMDFIYKF